MRLRESITDINPQLLEKREDHSAHHPINKGEVRKRTTLRNIPHSKVIQEERPSVYPIFPFILPGEAE